MAIVWRLSLNPSKVETVTTAVGNSFHRRIADGKKRLLVTCIIWDPVTQKNIRELEMVQRRAACFVTGDYRTISSVTQMLEALQWTELQQRRKRAKVIRLYRIVNHLVAISPQLSYTEGCSTNN
jgi:hypothetical protein